MKKNSWFRFLILQCCAVTVSVSQLKVSAVMEQVAQGFSISMGAAAGLMSFFTVAGIVLAIPGAALMERMGAKRLLLLLMACLFAGNAVGAVAGAYPLLMAGRCGLRHDHHGWHRSDQHLVSTRRRRNRHGNFQYVCSSRQFYHAEWRSDGS